MDNRTDISGFILAGGKSSRMGKDKALLELNSESLLKRMIGLLMPHCTTIYISGSPERYSGFGLEILDDFYKGCGPMGGLHASLSYSPTEWNLVTSVDTPFINPELIALLISGIGYFDAVVPQHRTGIEPLIGLYNKRALSIIENQIRNGKYKMRQLLSELNVNYIDCSHLLEKFPDLFLNINFPEDFSRIRS